ncbi:MAG: gamma-glutamylcyclotransferase [Betaproteobacteria bacterium]|nr:gamma-glutamylcyclotransferase [Betaproteobacteria bacterium]
MRAAVRASGHGHLLVSDEDLERSLELALAQRQGRDPVWIFGYGSLIWSPLFHSVERRVARVHGYHRGFYLWSFINRGSPESPGLVLALDRGGSCTGVAYRLDESVLRDELALIWRREMIMSTYTPRWVSVSTAGGPVRAIAFVINRDKPTYAGKLTDEQIVSVMLRARGHYGPCADYLTMTAESLAREGLPDRHLERLVRLIDAVRPAPAASVASE